MKVFAYIILTIVAIFLICYIGIPSRLISKNIDASSINRIKEANKVLVKAQLHTPHESERGLTQFLTYGYGRIATSEQVDQLFSFLTNAERDKIKLLFDKKDVAEIDLHEQSCIKYTIKSSINLPLLNSSAETLYLIHNNNCDCHCENVGFGSKDTAETKALGNGWFQIALVIARTRIEC
jgi:hypothetical protein